MEVFCKPPQPSVSPMALDPEKTLLGGAENIIQDNLVKLEKYKDNPPNYSYIAGLIDGDGTIFIRKILDGYQSGISLTQSRTNILQILKYHYGGSIIHPTGLNIENIINEDGYYDENNKRNSYTLIIRSNEYRFILNDIMHYIILKKTQIDLLHEFSKIANKPNHITEKEQLCSACLEQNKIKTLEKYDYSKLNLEYIQGLFDAEGYIYVSYKKIDNVIKFTKGVYMKITQKSRPEILAEIQKFLGFGKCGEYTYYVDNFEDCLKLVTLLKPNLIIKYNQIIAFEEYLNMRLEKNKKYNQNIHFKREHIYKIINMEKHQIEIYEETEEIEKSSKDGFNKKNSEIIENINIDKELQKKAFYIEKSESMKGENHMYYGQKLSDNHALKISLATTNAKRAGNPNLTNEKIREIYALKGNEKQIDVAEKYDMNREIIRRIWNRLIIPTDDPKFLTQKQELVSSNKSDNNSEIILTNEQKTSMGKRTLSSDEYLEILSWKLKKENQELLDGKKIFSTILSVYLSKLWDKKVSNDMVKNIWCGKTKLFEFEFQDKNISYEKYLEIIRGGDV
jgi:hypothetical protein